MAVRELPRTRLFDSVRELLETTTVVAVVPLGEPRAAAGDIWEVARIAARGGRRVALVDLGLEHGPLAPPQGTAPSEGIVDAFLYGASLQRVAVEQDVAGLHYIGAGTQAPEPREVWANARWQRLARGFASEGALLLLVAPPEALQHLAAATDLMLALGAGVPPAAARRHPLLAGAADAVLVLEEAPAEAAERPRPAARTPRPASTKRVKPRRRRTWALAGLAVAALGAAGALIALPGNGEGAAPAGAVPADAPSQESSTGAAAAASAVPRPGDSLFYAVQVAAFQTMANALREARAFEDAGWAVTVTAVRLGQQGTWHRLIVGALPDAGAAQGALADLWRARLLDRPNGTILRTPHAYLLDALTDSAALIRREGLRAQGIPAYIVGAPDGTARLLVGAFETPQQARLADSILTAAGLEGTLVSRAGIAR
jgi:hypothetical protein